MMGHLFSDDKLKEEGEMNKDRLSACDFCKPLSRLHNTQICESPKMGDIICWSDSRVAGVSPSVVASCLLGMHHSSSLTM